MKRRTLFMILVFCLFGLCGCGKNKKSSEIMEFEADFVYPADEISAFCPDEEGNLYTYVKETSSICVFDKKGVQTKCVETEPKKYYELCCGDGVLYAFVSEDTDKFFMSKPYLVEISLEDGVQKKLYENFDAWTVQGLEYCNKKLYFIEKEPVDAIEAELLSDPSEEYYYNGEKLICYSPETGEAEELSIERIKVIAKKDADTLWVYAYDMDYGKYYFATYEPEMGIVGERSYVGDYFNVFLEEFAYDTACDKLLRADIFKSVLVAMNPENINSQSGFYTVEAGLASANGLVCQNGRSYFLLNGEIHRIKNSNYIKDYEPLRIYYSSHEYKMPEATGFEIDMVEVDEETMAMSMMAGDSDYDFLLLSTESSVAEQIRRVGAFEPLNEVAGVEEYLQGSFDYIRDAATDTNGAVWMLPCDVSCDVLLYNPKLCKEYGIDFEKGYSNEALLKAQKALEEAEKSGNSAYYSYNFSGDRKRMAEIYLTNYAVVNGKACFDTELFREYSELFRGDAERNGGVFRYAWLNPGNDAPVFGATEEDVATYYAEYFSQVAFVSADKYRLTTEYSNSIGGGSYGLLGYDFFEAKAMPSLEEEKSAKNLASAFILVLNPNSAHLKEAKEFLSVLTGCLNEEESIYRTKKLQGEYTALELKVHDIYADAKIVFSYPYDVFWDEYLKYLNGEKSLDEVIPELERKLNLYLKE